MSKKDLLRWENTTLAERTAMKHLCESSLSGFLRVFFQLMQGQKFKNNWHHDLFCEKAESIRNGESNRDIINCPPGATKAIDCETPMWTERGWLSAGDVQLGDSLLGSDGQWTKVIGVHPQGVKDAYDVRFSDSSGLVACKDHRWAVALRDVRSDRGWVAPWRVKNTGQLTGDLREADGRKKWHIPMLHDSRSADIDLPIEPYALGCWLGDGHSHYAAITTMDSEVLEGFSGYELRAHRHQNAGKAVTYGIRGGLNRQLREQGLLKNKHIPDLYLNGSFSQRLALLQGMCDTDGCVTARGSQFFATSSPVLSRDFMTLACSLGFSCRVTTRQPLIGKLAYRIVFKAPDGVVAFRVSRKVTRISKRSAKNTPVRHIDSITKTTAREMVCFTVDAADSLFCAGREFVVTHNTEIWSVHWPVWCIVKALQDRNSTRWLPLSYSDDLVTENSSRCKAIIESEPFQYFWPLKLSRDIKAKSDWQFIDQHKNQHRMFGTSILGQVTGRRAGFMDEGFTGALILDDPLPPRDEGTKRVHKYNLALNRIVRSRLAQDEIPIVMVQQRITKSDSTSFLLSDKAPDDYNLYKVPALVDRKYLDELPEAVKKKLSSIRGLLKSVSVIGLIKNPQRCC